MGKLRKDERLRRLYMSYIDDGILDMFVGFIALFAGILMFTDMLWMAGVYVAIFLPTVWSIKEKVTMPRLRSEELSPDTAKSSTKMLGAFIAGLLVFMVLGVLFLLLQNDALMPITREVFMPIIAGLIAAVVLGGFIAVGHMYHASRWYAYAAVILAIGALAWWLGIELPWVIAATGAMMAMTGTIYLARFLHSHPILPEEERPAW